METFKTDKKIREIDVYQELGEEKINQLRPLFTQKAYKKGTVISKPGDRGLVYVIKSGRVEIYEITASGKKFIHSILKRGGIFGDFNMENPTVYYSKTIESAEISEIKTNDFMKMIKNEPELLIKLLEYFYTRMLIAQKKAASIATEDVFRRLTKLLICMGRPDDALSELVTDKFTHEQISHMLGVSRQTITTMISALQKKGIIRRKKKTFIFNQSKLEKATEK